jgi:peptidoglycan/xylan/chitin deacetylase (PgdA/CDA1 family)
LLKLEPASPKWLTLTFDNGPDPEATPQVLEVLRERRVTAWFFVLGKHVATEQGRQLVERTIAEGHLIGNHSYTHARPLGEDNSEEAVQAEIVATAELLEPLLRAQPDGERWFRPFGGGGEIGPHLLSCYAAKYLSEMRYTCVLWSSVPRDWEDAEGWPERAIADCDAQQHTVMVLHDVSNACAARLGRFLDLVRNRGIQLTTVLPRWCTPIAAGEVVGSLRELMTPRPRRAE